MRSLFSRKPPGADERDVTDTKTLHWGRSQTVAALSGGKVMATDGTKIVAWDQEGKIERTTALKEPAYDDDQMSFVGAEVNTFAIAPDGSQVVLGGYVDTSNEVQIHDGTSGALLANLHLRIGFPGTLEVAHAVVSLDNQFIASLHNHPNGDWDDLICVWRGRRFTEVRLKIPVLRRLLLLCRTGRAELTPALPTEDDTFKFDRLSVLVSLAKGTGAEMAGTILEQLKEPGLPVPASNPAGASGESGPSSSSSPPMPKASKTKSPAQPKSEEPRGNCIVA